MVAASPLRERRWGQLVVAAYRCGRQADALRAYQRCRAVLARELGLEPGPGLRRLEAAVLAQDPSLDWQPDAAAGAGTAPAPPMPAGAQPAEARPAGGPATASLVGRDPELAHLRARLRHVASGHGGAVVLVGEPGAARPRWRRRRRAWPPTRGSRPPGAGAWTPRPRPRSGRGARCCAHCRTGPGPGRPGSGWMVTLRPGEDSVRQFRAYEAVAAALGEAAADVPVLVVVDDLHAADGASLALLQLLAGDLHRMAVLLLFTVRSMPGPGAGQTARRSPSACWPARSGCGRCPARPTRR